MKPYKRKWARAEKIQKFFGYGEHTLVLTRGGKPEFLVFYLFFVLLLLLASTLLCGYVTRFNFFGTSLTLSLDRLSFMFLCVLFLIVSCIFIYAGFYISAEINFTWFASWLSLFVLSIVTLIISESWFLLFLAWDGLGLTSFILVSYYLNWERLNGAMVTIITNRIGDAFLFLFLFSWFIDFYSFRLVFGVPLFVVVAAMTKSAQTPFSSWLPRAMSAPTPVSALVHSSTLVTAGVFLILKFSIVCYSFSFLLFWVGLITLVLARLRAISEMDLKKLVALSTLSQIGFLFMSLGFATASVTVFHLARHALFKSCLFMCVGGIIHINSRAQDIRYFNLRKSNPLITSQLIVTCLSMRGVFFSSGFVSKDTILELFRERTSGILVMLVLVFSVWLTLLYCLRILRVLISYNGMFPNSSITHTNQLSKNFTFSTLPLTVFSVCSLWFFNVNFSTDPSIFLTCDTSLSLAYFGLALLCAPFLFRFSLSFSGLFYQDSFLMWVSLLLPARIRVLEDRLFSANYGVFSMFRFFIGSTSYMFSMRGGAVSTVALLIFFWLLIWVVAYSTSNRVILFEGNPQEISIKSTFDCKSKSPNLH